MRSYRRTALLALAMAGCTIYVGSCTLNVSAALPPGVSLEGGSTWTMRGWSDPDGCLRAR